MHGLSSRTAHRDPAGATAQKIAMAIVGGAGGFPVLKNENP
jgi:hypothetical protein